MMTAGIFPERGFRVTLALDRPREAVWTHKVILHTARVLRATPEQWPEVLAAGNTRERIDRLAAFLWPALRAAAPGLTLWRVRRIMRSLTPEQIGALGEAVSTVGRLMIAATKDK